MLHTRLYKALEKAGFKPVAPGDTANNRNRMWTAAGPKYCIEWYKQDDDAVCVSVRQHNDHSDAMVDYHAGFFARTIKSAVYWIQEK